MNHAKAYSIAVLIAVAMVAGVTGWLAMGVTREHPGIVPVHLPPTPSPETSGADRANLESVGLAESETGRLLERNPPRETPSASRRARVAELRAKMEDYARVEGWDKTYATLDADDLLDELDVVETAILEATRDEFEKMFKSGQYEVLATDGQYKPTEFDTGEVFWVRWAEHGRVLKAVLPESGFESVYKLQAQSVWLWKAAQRKGGGHPR